MAFKLDLLCMGLVFGVAVVSVRTVCFNYGWLCALLWTIFLGRLGFYQFLSILFRWICYRGKVLSYSSALRHADLMRKPVRRKNTWADENEFLAFGCSNMQGWRRTMEDAHTFLLLEDGGFFGIYDGHKGLETAKFCGKHMYKFVSHTQAFKEGDIQKALSDGFIAADKYLFYEEGHEGSGCTAVVLYVKGDDLYCANAGDSRCVLCKDGEAYPMSVDHKPFNPIEQTRIERAGGYVLNRRVNGVLALSRAIGDFDLKSNTKVPWDQQAVTSMPDVHIYRLNRDKDEFAVIACDGIWDVLSNEQVIGFVRPLIQQRKPLGEIAELLIDRCLSPSPFTYGCDNMSVIIIQFKRHIPRQLPVAPAIASNVSALMNPGEKSLSASGKNTPLAPTEGIFSTVNGYSFFPPVASQGVSGMELAAGKASLSVDCCETKCDSSALYHDNGNMAAVADKL